MSKTPVTTRTRAGGKPNVSLKDLSEVAYEKLFEERLTVPEKTVKGILTLIKKGQIPVRHHNFYHALKHGEEGSDQALYEFYVIRLYQILFLFHWVSDIQAFRFC
jgi:hypothetical protein